MDFVSNSLQNQKSWRSYKVHTVVYYIFNINSIKI